MQAWFATLSNLCELVTTPPFDESSPAHWVTSGLPVNREFRDSSDRKRRWYSPRSSTPPPSVLMLEATRKAHHDATRRTDGVTGKKTSKIDDIDNVCKILPIDLKAHIQPLRLVDVRAHRCA